LLQFTSLQLNLALLISTFHWATRSRKTICTPL